MSSFVFADRFVLPETSPLLSPRLHQLFYISLAFQHTAYHILANTWLKGESKDMLKKRCWILTTMASAVMCAASLPFLVDLLTSGFDLHQLRPRTKTVAEPLAAYFVAYLVSDLGLGSIYYRSMINLSSGWIHHTAYVFFFSWWTHRGWAHLAATAAIFELPTLIMGLASIHPPLRSNMAFTVTFFATRVFYHLGLILASITEHGRNAPGIDGSKGPVISMVVTYPMHLWWGYKCILSVRRRMRKRKLAAREVQSAKASVAASAGQLFTGLPAPDVSSAVNTPATTPGAGAIPATANFGSTGPVHSTFAKAASMARPPVNLLLPRSRRRSSASADTGSDGAPAGPGKAKVAVWNEDDLLREAPLLNRRLSSKYINSQSVFTAPVAPLGAGPGDAEPFLAIRSPAEAKDRARRLVADAVRKAWLSAPAGWRRQYEEEADSSRRLHAVGSSVSSSSSSSLEMEDDDDDAEGEYGDALDSPYPPSPTAGEQAGARARTNRYLSLQKAKARRAVLRAVRTAINGRDADGLSYLSSHTGESEGLFGDGAVLSSSTNSDGKVDKTLLSLDFSALVRYLPPDFFARGPGGMTTGQDFEVTEYPVERGDGGRRRRIVGQIRRRIEVARRDMVVF